jgi:hypothetical protein
LDTPPEGGSKKAQPPPSRKRVEAHIFLNQVGYLPHDPKRAVLPASGALSHPDFTIIDDAVAPEVRFRGHLARYAKPIPKNALFPVYYHADFDAFHRPGRYRLRLADGRISEPFSIGRDVYNQLIPLVLTYFDTQTCGNHRSEAHGPCHTDDGIIAEGPRKGQRIDVSGGWHDAGDYLKFVETTSFVTALLAAAADRYQERHPAGTHGPVFNLFLERLRVGLDWLLKMHPSPNEFYYQVGNDSDHDYWRLPEDDTRAKNPDWKPRPVYPGVGANLAGRVAASLAIAARLYRRSDPKFAQRCLTVAESAYQLGLKDRKILTTNPADYYPEKTWADDMEWGAAELYATTRRSTYLEQALYFSKQAGSSGDVPNVYGVHALAHFALMPHVTKGDRDRLLEYIHADALKIKQHADNPYSLGVPLIWGTAEAAAGAALVCRLYGMLTNNKSYLDLAVRHRDLVLGCNPWGISFLVGAGTRYPLFPHHQIANLRGIELTGALVGGPTSIAIYKGQNLSLNEAEFDEENLSPPLTPDKPNQIAVYHDAVQDYVTNEPANDYTAKFLLVAALDSAAP